MKPEHIEKEPQRVLDALESKGHAVFTNTSKPYNLNIVGIRDHNRKAGTFDDVLTILWRRASPGGGWLCQAWQITTDPGIHYLHEPINWRGCAILAAGQYRGAYAIDLHRGQYPALCQRLGPVTVFRDRDRDSQLDLDPSKLHTGFFGINIHRPAESPKVNAQVVNAFSAGCQVFQRGLEHVDFMNLCRNAAGVWGNKFTYTLIHEEDLES